MSHTNNLDRIYQSLKHLSSSGYDSNKYSLSLLQQTRQLEYYYYHKVHMWKRPHFHQLAYFNIGRGFPKEIMDGHWCYVVKNLGDKMLVVPCTSIKSNKYINHKNEKYIAIRCDKHISYCCMHLSDIRTIDVLRLDLRKPIYQVLTPREEIIDFIEKNLFN